MRHLAAILVFLAMACGPDIPSPSPDIAEDSVPFEVGPPSCEEGEAYCGPGIFSRELRVCRDGFMARETCPAGLICYVQGDESGCE